jgi:hypothetical protein
MKKWISLPWLFAILASTSPVAFAQPRPGDHPGDRPGDHPGDHPGEHPGDHPGEHPGDHPGVMPAAEYGARLQKIEDERRLKRGELRRDPRLWEAGRAAREEEHRRQLEGVWGAPFLARPECRGELELHADRVARIDRIIDIAEDTHNAALLAHAQRVLARETARHTRVMYDLRVRLGVL